MIEAVATGGLGVLGSAAFGAGAKILAGTLSDILQASKEKRMFEAATILKLKGEEIRFQEAVFGMGPDAKAARMTRRILAIMMFSGLLFTTVWCVLFPDKLYIGHYLKADAYSTFLWGLIRIPKDPEVVRFVSSLGSHIYSILQMDAMVTAFYFTPGGRK